jgi:sugar O-acyltransferase, sialic acid O-acetyltransferase neuD family
MLHEKLIIIGAGGHGRVVADIAEQVHRYKSIAFLDDVTPSDAFSYPFLGDTSKAENFIHEYDIFVAIGNSKARQKFMERLAQHGAIFPTLIHPNAVISKDVVIEMGTVIMPGVVINRGAKLGLGVIVNTSSSIDHDCTVDDYCHIAVGSHICGTVKIGQHTWIGAGATVNNNISICSFCAIGAGSVVIRDIATPCTVVGCPAHLLHENV